MNLVLMGMSTSSTITSQVICKRRRVTNLIVINALGVGTVVCKFSLPLQSKKVADEIARIVDSILLIRIIDPGHKSLLRCLL